MVNGCFAEITEFAKELHSEMEKVVLMNELPENWTYPLIQPKLIEKYLRVKNNSIIGATVTVTVDRPLGSYHPEYKDMYRSSIGTAISGLVSSATGAGPTSTPSAWVLSSRHRPKSSTKVPCRPS